MSTHKTVALGELSTRQLRTRRRRLTGRLPDWESYLAGSLAEQHRRCGKEGCRCARGELHGPYVYLSVGKRSGGRASVYVPETLARLVRRRLMVSEQAQQLLAQISAINLELLARRELE